MLSQLRSGRQRRGTSICQASCPALLCADGFVGIKQAGDCCPSCIPSTGQKCSTSADCPQTDAVCQACPDGSSSCPSYECLNGLCAFSSPACAPGDGGAPDACTLGQQGYTTLRQGLLAPAAATACKLDTDCEILQDGGSCAFDYCSYTSVNAAMVDGFDEKLSAYAADYCSSCKPIYPPCPAPMSPVCKNGQCAFGTFGG